MTLTQYLENRAKLASRQFQPREVCARCEKSQKTCYCLAISTIKSQISFAILIHPSEVERGVATGRMAHLSLPNSHLIEGVDFTNNPRVNALISDPKNYCMVLSPGMGAANLNELSSQQKQTLVPAGKQLVVFLLDATWGEAKRMRRLSRNLHSLPLVCFTPKELSGFLVRKQPAEHCYSTIEAIHYFLELMHPDQDFSNLLAPFHFMVEQQLRYRGNFRKATRGSR